MPLISMMARSRIPMRGSQVPPSFQIHRAKGLIQDLPIASPVGTLSRHADFLSIDPTYTDQINVPEV
jgi:hypothetical protein